MSFEVAWRILRATPVTATGLVCALLLTTHGAALTLDQLHHTLQDSLDYLERKQTPMSTSALRLRTREGVRAAVDALSNGHPITRVDSGREPVWRIAPDDELAAAFYRNSVIHAFLETSIVELALAHARRADGDRMEAFWAQAMRLRDLLKFDFYFADSAAFRDNIAEEMAWHQDWETHVAAGGNEIDAMLFAKRPLMSDAMLRVFFEAYEIVADVLRDAPADIGQKELTESGARGRPSVRGAGPGPQQRIGVDAAVRHRAPGGRRSGSDRARPRSRRTPDRFPAGIAGHSAGFRLRREDRAQSVRRPRVQGAPGGSDRPNAVVGSPAHTLGT